MDNRFLKLTDHELKHLLFEAHVQPDSFESDAKRQISQAAAVRGISVGEVVREYREAAADDKKQQVQKEAKRRRFDLHYGRVMGVLGFITAVITGFLSALTGHIGGLMAAVVTGGCSLWLILRRQ
jgi:hypothetical protein